MRTTEYYAAELFAPEAFWDTDPEDLDGGCGAGKLGDLFVPDSMWGLSVRVICQIHDFMYLHGKTIKDKNSADRAFLNNLIRWIDYKTKFPPLKWLRHRRALKYFEAVQLFGGPAFWRGKN